MIGINMLEKYLKAKRSHLLESRNRANILTSLGKEKKHHGLIIRSMIGILVMRIKQDIRFLELTHPSGKIRKRDLFSKTGSQNNN